MHSFPCSLRLLSNRGRKDDVLRRGGVVSMAADDAEVILMLTSYKSASFTLILTVMVDSGSVNVGWASCYVT